MKKGTFLFIASVILTLGMCQCAKTTNDEQATEASLSTEAHELDSICHSLFPADEPGAAVLVMRGDSIVFNEGYGLADLDTKTPISDSTFFNIASVSKQFTAVAILQLAEEGKLSLNDAVAQYMPYRWALWKEVRLRHLLSHSSGVPDCRGGIPREEKIHGTDSLAIAYLDTLTTLRFFPGTAYEYINPTFVLCGKLVEKVSGEPFSEYMQRHVFAPAGMEAYYIADNEDIIPHMAHGYEYADVTDMPEERTAESPSTVKKNWYEYDYGEETFFATRPDGGLYTSVRQFARWEQALRSHAVLSESYLKDAWSPHTQVSGSPWSNYQNRPNTWYGYGWFIEPATDSTKTVIYHTGDNGGFKILAARYPEDDALVLVFANRADWDRYALMQKIEKIYCF